jgi:hypothetical protein
VVASVVAVAGVYAIAACKCVAQLSEEWESQTPTCTLASRAKEPVHAHVIGGVWVA